MSQDADSHTIALREVARWTHAWLGAAIQALESLDAHWNDDDPVGSIGVRDAFALLMVGAVRNLYRGAAIVLGNEHPALADFDAEAPALREMRDRLEHFDEYARGTGRHQKATLDLAPAAMTVVGSSGGGPAGHTFEISTTEQGKRRTYTIETATTARAARALGLIVCQSMDLDDEEHQRRCRLCRPSGYARPI